MSVCVCVRVEQNGWKVTATAVGMHSTRSPPGYTRKGSKVSLQEEYNKYSVASSIGTGSVENYMLCIIAGLQARIVARASILPD